MSQLRVDLDATPDVLAAYLAAVAAVRATVGLDFTSPDPGLPEWRDDEGSWLAVLRLGDGRALLLGWHPEFSVAEGSGLGGEAEADLVGDAPGWWRRGVELARGRGDHLGFLYAYDGARWWRFDQPLDDGFDPEYFPVTEYAVRELVEAAAADTLLDDPAPEAVTALLAAGAELEAEHLTAVLHSPDGWPEVRPDAGVAAARRFRELALT